MTRQVFILEGDGPGTRGESGADLEGPYRYRLWRTMDPSGPRALFVMLNPSTADARQDDATIRRCIRFATDWGYGRLDVVNLLAWRATDPAELRRVPRDQDIVGPRNLDAIRAAARESDLVVAAWGACGYEAIASRVSVLVTQEKDLHHLGLTKQGHPRHPLYLATTARPVLWRPRRTLAPTNP